MKSISGIKKEGNPAVRKTRVNLESLMLLEVSQTEKYKYCIILFIGETLQKKS